MIELLSIDLSNYCSKQCPFCYNHSTKEGNVMWLPEEVIDFCKDCMANGVKAVSLGGGEPFEYDGIFDIIDALYPECYLSVTTNGLPLTNPEMFARLLRHKPDKIHITIHHPDSEIEVCRVINQIHQIKATSIKPGVNLLVGADNISAAQTTFRRLKEILNTGQIIIIPQRFSNTPTARQISTITDGEPFQSPSCLLGCKRPMEFASVSWDKKVSSCSYTPNKEHLKTLDFKGLDEALRKTEWTPCTT